MQDNLIKAITKDGYFRAYAINGTHLVSQSAQTHQTSRLGSVVLGRGLLATLLTANAVLKGEERLSITINGRGPIGNLVVEANAKGSVRGYVTNPQIENITDDAGHLSVGQAVGQNGFLQITKFAPYSDPYIGQIQLATGEIGDDFTYYLAQSEQIPSVVGVSVYMNEDDTVSLAGGFLIQGLPGVTESALRQLEESLAQLPALPDMLKVGLTPLQVLEKIFGMDALDVLVDEPVGLASEPTKAEYAKMLGNLSANELQNMIDEDHGAEVVGKFSGKKYFFDEDELKVILKEIESK